MAGMELRQLRYFLEIYRRSSFGQAADALGLSQPALSKSIRNLEQELRVELLERLPSGVAPTPYGEIVAEYAALVENELRRARAEIEAMSGSTRGLVSVGAGTTNLRFLMPAAAAAFRARFPEVRLRLTSGLKDELVAMLRRGDLDLAVVGALDPATHADLVYEPLLTDRLAVVAWRGHPLAGQARLGWADLAPHPWIFPSQSEAERRQLNGFFQAAGLQPPVAAIETDSAVLMADLIMGSACLSYLPRRMLLNDRVYAELVELQVAQDWPAVGLGVAYRRVSVRLPPARNFIAEVKRVAAELAAREGPPRP